MRPFPVLRSLALATLAFFPSVAFFPALTFFPTVAQGQIPDAEYHERRAALTAPDGDGVTLILGSASTRAAHLSFLYLSGLVETDAVILVERTGGEIRSTLYVSPDDPTPARIAGGVVQGGDATNGAGALAVRPMGALEQDLPPLLARFGAVTLVGQDDLRAAAGALSSRTVAAMIEGRDGLEIRRGNARVNQMRAVKSEAELALIRRSVEITEAAHRALLWAIRPGITEADLKVVVDSVFSSMGADRVPAFGHIVASAENSTILHYRGGDRVIGENEHIKIDIGAAVHGYAADVTRTYPANGVYSPEVRAIYEVVLAAQAAAEAVAREGGERRRMSEVADQVLAEGLTRLGLIDAPDATYECSARGGGVGSCRQLGLHYFHSLGHGIGLNVHDPTDGTTVSGSAISIEPGIYVRPGFLETLPDTPANRAMIARITPAWTRYEGIGVRIEDDYIMTDRGLEWISRAPREIAEIEAAMATARAAREAREARDASEAQDAQDAQEARPASGGR
jgi:Xaa-Pro aminopeptidase